MTYAFVVKRPSVNAVNLSLFSFLFVCCFGSFSKCLSLAVPSTTESHGV